jgi:hypothetical protein
VAHQVEVGRLHAGRLAQAGQAEAEKRSHVDGVESGLVFCGMVTKKCCNLLTWLKKF